jgi:hypothetical protein
MDLKLFTIKNKTMETLQIEKSTIQNAYRKATPKEKAWIESIFGKDAVATEITERVKTFEDACSVLGYEPDEEAYEHAAPEVTAYLKLHVIIKALNEGWEPDWKNLNEYKYYPYFYMDKTRYSPSGFSLAGVNFSCSRSSVGSRLCFKNEALAKYAVTQFLDLYKQYYTA